MNLDAYSTKDIDNYQRLYVLQRPTDDFVLSKFGNIEAGEVLMSLNLQTADGEQFLSSEFEAVLGVYVDTTSQTEMITVC